MYIKRMAKDNQSDPREIHIVHKNRKLPIIQLGLPAQTSRLMKTRCNFIFDSLRPLSNFSDKSPEYIYRSPKINSNRSNQILNEMKKKASLRMKTDPNEEKEMMKRTLATKKSIVDKIVYITRELGLGGADYNNYMKTCRKTNYKGSLELTMKQGSIKKTYQSGKITQSMAIESLGAMSEQKKLGSTNIKEDWLSLWKLNLKQKPLVKYQRTYNEQNKIKERDGLRKGKDMNGSIRGWSKYFKNYQELQS